MVRCRQHRTGVVHPAKLFDDWVVETTRRFGGITVLATDLLGLWYDPDLAIGANPVEDHSNWYKIAVEARRVLELEQWIERAVSAFGQKCLYFERSGEARFLRPPENARSEE